MILVVLSLRLLATQRGRSRAARELGRTTTGFCATRALPSAVFGPVLCVAFRRFASMRRMLATVILLSFSIVSAGSGLPVFFLAAAGGSAWVAGLACRVVGVAHRHPEILVPHELVEV